MTSLFHRRGLIKPIFRIPFHQTDRAMAWYTTATKVLIDKLFVNWFNYYAYCEDIRWNDRNALDVNIIRKVCIRLIFDYCWVLTLFQLQTQNNPYRWPISFIGHLKHKVEPRFIQRVYLIEVHLFISVKLWCSLGNFFVYKVSKIFSWPNWRSKL